MNTIQQATSREQEIEQVKRCIERTDAEIHRIESVLAQMRKKQIARHVEVARQTELARQLTRPSNAPGERRGEQPTV